MYLQINHLKKAFGNSKVLSNVSLELPKNQTLSVLGRSGSGKTTLLKIIAGLLAADEGDIFLNNENINQVAAAQRNIVYLYQESLLFPHLNAFENIAFGLRLRKASEIAIKEKVNEMLIHLGLQGFEKQMPHQLSGGQRQRVAFGRALMVNPAVLLLDEPFGALDVETREQMQQLYKRIATDYRTTAIFVTHDIKEAILMGDNIGYMAAGELTIYDQVQDFLTDSRTGAGIELNFWKNLI